MSLINDQLQHEVYIQRFATELLKSKLFPSLKEADEAVRALLGEYDEIKSAAQVRKIEKLVNAIVSDTVVVAWEEATKELEGLAVYEADYYANLVGGYADLVLEHPSARNIADYMRSALMVLGEGERVKVGAWADFVQQNTDGLAQQYNNLVKAGYARGASAGQIRRSIQMYNQGLAKQQVTALARTGAQHYANSAREAMALDNADIIKKRYFLSVLDNRTTIGCRALHGKTWDIDDDKYVRLPRHVNCRSSYLYLLDGQDKPEGNQVAIGSGKDYPKDAEKKPTYKGRKSKDIFDIERVNTGTTADSWLRSQSEAFIIDSLGPTRAKLFIAGEPLERMADAFGNPLTLEQMRQRDAEAFKRAGLEGG